MAGDRRLLHAITRAGSGGRDSGLDTIAAASLQAICSPLDEQAEEGDPEWLAAAAQRHHTIVQQLLAAGPVLPIRFGTIVEGDAIAPLLERHQEMLRSELDRLDGHTEWGVKLFVDTAALGRAAEHSSEALRALDEEIATSAQGKAYLLKRRREAGLAEAIEQHVCAMVEQVRSRLAQLASDTADLPLPPVLPAGKEMLANLSFLVPNARTDEFTTAADRVAHELSLQFELSGPWPPYSFVRLNLDGSDEH